MNVGGPGARRAPPRGGDAGRRREAVALACGAAAARDEAGPKAFGLRSPARLYPTPERGRGPVGALRPGTRLGLLGAERRAGKGCRGGWLAAAPAGFLCNDEKISLDPAHPLADAAVAELVAPARDAPLPYRYAFSRGAPLYGRLPTAAERARVEGPAERGRRARKPGGGFGGHDELAVEDEIAAEGDVPAALAGGRPLPTPAGPAPLVRKWVPEGSTVAFARAFRAEGRTWLISAELGLVPADRVLGYRVSAFGGVRLGGGRRLPIAWARRAARALYRREGGGWRATGETFGPRASVAVTGERVAGPGGAYWRVEGEGERFVAEAEVAVVEAHGPPPGLGRDEKWVEVRLRAGTLVAYEGERPVFATLVSGGAGAPGDSDRELVAKNATPVGTYRVTWKVAAARMTPERGEPKRFWLADVPHALYFRAPFAIHAAYWHEDFGVPKSAGCVNVSPADGAFLFAWADPPLPPGWQGVGPGRATGLGTRVIVAP